MHYLSRLRQHAANIYLTTLAEFPRLRCWPRHRSAIVPTAQRELVKTFFYVNNSARWIIRYKVDHVQAAARIAAWLKGTPGNIEKGLCGVNLGQCVNRERKRISPLVIILYQLPIMRKLFAGRSFRLSNQIIRP